MVNALERARVAGEEPNINIVYLPLEYKSITTITTSVMAVEHQFLHP